MIRVAAYCRVSTDKSDQTNSFISQQEFFINYISGHSDWELWDVYADEGITGTSTKKRTQFNRMMNDAHMGKFDMVITKEVSRFSRNILDTIAYTRELKALGIGVIFMNDGISTMEPDSELRLSIMGSIAQEESRKTSDRVKWGQTRQMEKGVVFGRSLLGYNVENGRITVNRKEAETVRYIFRKYGIEKTGAPTIAKELFEAGYKTYSGDIKWSGGYILKILRNEKYVGDLVQKKTFTPDYLTHAKKYNHGEESFIIIRDHHEPIIDRELWNIVQKRLSSHNRHNGLNSEHSDKYIFSGKIKCGECGSNFVSRKKYRKNGAAYLCWGCGKAMREGANLSSESQTGCGIGKMMRDEFALQMVKMSLENLDADIEKIRDSVTSLAVNAVMSDVRGSENLKEKLKRSLSKIEMKKMDVMDAYFSGDISRNDMQALTKRYNREMEDMRSKIESADIEMKTDTEAVTREIKDSVESVLNGETVSKAFYRALVKSITLYKDRHAELELNELSQKWVFTISKDK